MRAARCRFVAKETVRVKGLREVQRAFREVDKDIAKEIRERLRGVGSIVQQGAAQLLAPISPASAQSFKVRVRQRGVAVEQSKGRTTGLRPDFGVLQMNRALLPALDAHGSEVERKLEEMLDDLDRKAGF
jgi:hypothetical protein